MSFAIYDDKFPDEMKITELFPLYKNDGSNLMENYSPVSIYLKCLQYTKESYRIKLTQTSILCSFRAGYSTQHTLIRLLGKWGKFLDRSGLVGTILMD